MTENPAELKLTEREARALFSLARISCGEQAFLNVLDADDLVKKGLAEIFGKGQYVLTDAGEALLAKLGIKK